MTDKETCGWCGRPVDTCDAENDRSQNVYGELCSDTPESLAQKAANAIDPRLFEPAIRKAADDFYEQLLTGVQDYLQDNVEFNLSSHMLMLHCQIKSLKDAAIVAAGERDNLIEAGNIMAGELDALADFARRQCEYEGDIDAAMGSVKTWGALIARVSA